MAYEHREEINANTSMSDYNRFVVDIASLEKMDGAPTDGAFDQALCDVMLLRALKWAAENNGSINHGVNALFDLMRERALEFFPAFEESKQQEFA